MKNLRFEEAQLLSKIEHLSRHDRTAFAGACAERMLRAYSKFSDRTGWGNPAKLREILTRLWSDLAGDAMSETEADAQIHETVELIPGENDRPLVLEQAAAEDAVSAVAYALRSRQSGLSQEAVWAARRAYEALDHFVINHEHIDTNSAGAEARVLAHPLIQAELLRQQRDLEELLRGTITLQQLRERSKEEAAYFLP
jgi:uncharacterized protein YjaG (DUF416 family)